MIAGLARLLVVVLVAQAVIYLVIWLYARSVRREALEIEWSENGATGERDDYVREGMQDYGRRLRRRLVWGVLVVPIVALAILLYLLTSN